MNIVKNFPKTVGMASVVLLSSVTFSSAMAKNIADDDFQKRVCARVENRMFPDHILERVNRRLSKRFGFVCEVNNTLPTRSLPETIGTYQLPTDSNAIGGIQKKNECNTMNNKEYCTESLKSEYQSKNNNSVVFAQLTKIRKNSNLLANYLTQNSRPTSIHDNIYRLENAELFWFTSIAHNEIVLLKEGTVEIHENERRYSYGTATGNNDVMRYFLQQYPPVR